jgi:hypothetical protein
MLVLIAIITSFAFGGLSFGIRTWEKGTAASDLTIRYNRNAPLISSLIEQAYPLPIFTSSQTYVAFTGDTDHMTFLALLKGPGELGGYQRVTIRQQDGQLVLIRHDLANGQNEATTTLLENVKQLELAYYGSLRLGQSPTWHNHWREANTLPGLVRLRIKSDLQTAWWPDLIIEPKIERDARCIFTTIPNDCIYK